MRVRVTPEVAALAQREALRGVRWRNGPVAALGLFGVIGGVSFFLHPASVDLSAIGRNLNGHADDVWSGAWLIGGLLVIFGALRPHQLVELFGWAIYVPALVAYTVAVLALASYKPPSIYLALSVAAAGVAKGVYLIAFAPTTVRVKLDRRTDDPGGGEYGGEERRG